jgi:hypothetical protein
MKSIPTIIKKRDMSYAVKVQITGPGCDLDFTHVCNGSEMAAYAKQFAAIVAGEGAQTHASTATGLGGPYGKKAVGARVRADGFECPSVVFGKATKAGSKQRLETELGAAAPKTAGSVHDAIFGDEEEYDFDSETMQLGGGPIGGYSCTRK